MFFAAEEFIKVFVVRYPGEQVYGKQKCEAGYYPAVCKFCAVFQKECNRLPYRESLNAQKGAH